MVNASSKKFNTDTAAELAASRTCGDPSCGCGKLNPAGWLVAHCPGHHDPDPSLNIRDGDFGVVFKCFGGCTHEQLKEAFGLTTFTPKSPRPKITATYDYEDLQNNLKYQVVRIEEKGGKKSFRQRRPDPVNPGEWIWNMQGVELIPYRFKRMRLAATVLVVEGEKDCDNLRQIGFTATTNPMGAGKWRQSFNQYFEGKNIIILPDNDQQGRDHSLDVATNLRQVAKTLKILELPGLPEKGDVSDWIQAGGTREELRELISACPEWQPKVEPEPASPLDKLGIYTGDHLMAQEFPEAQYLVDKLLPEGVTIWAGKQKFGKGWLALGLCVAVAEGGQFLGQKMNQGVSLYAALEDSGRRLQDRIDKISPPGTLENLHYTLKMPPLDAGGVEWVESAIKEIGAGIKVVVLDCLKRIRGKRGQKNADSDLDYKEIAQLVDLANKYPGIAIIVIHHLRKMVSDTDPFDEVTGSHGITAAADCTWVMKRRRNQYVADLWVTGRDVPENHYKLDLDDVSWTWELLGTAEDVKKQDISQERQEIIDLLDESGPMRPREIATALGKNQNSIDQLLFKMKMEKGIIKDEKGYKLKK